MKDGIPRYDFELYGHKLILITGSVASMFSNNCHKCLFEETVEALEIQRKNTVARNVSYFRKFSSDCDKAYA